MILNNLGDYNFIFHTVCLFRYVRYVRFSLVVSIETCKDIMDVSFSLTVSIETCKEV